jgi:hypothetical protein
VAVVRLARLVSIGLFVVALSVTSVRADNTIQVNVTLRSPSNPSTYGQQLIFTVDVGHWCGDGSQPVIYLYDGAAAGPFGWAYLPNWNLPVPTISYFHSGLLSVGTHRLWGQAPRCIYQNTVWVDLHILDYFQTVKPAPAAAPRANPPGPKTVVGLQAAPKVQIHSAARSVRTQVEMAPFEKQASIQALPSPSGAVPIGVLALVGVVALGGLGYSWAARQRRRPLLRR